MQTNRDQLVDQAAYDRALQKIEQARGLLEAAQADLQGWAPPAAVNDVEAVLALLQSLPARLPARG
jgi:hypothetical protein